MDAELQRWLADFERRIDDRFGRFHRRIDDFVAVSGKAQADAENAQDAADKAHDRIDELLAHKRSLSPPGGTKTVSIELGEGSRKWLSGLIPVLLGVAGGSGMVKGMEWLAEFLK